MSIFHLFGGPLIFGSSYWIQAQTTIPIPAHYSVSFSFNFIRFDTSIDLGLSFNVDFGSWTIALNFANNYNGGIFSSVPGNCDVNTDMATTIAASNLLTIGDTVIFSISQNSGGGGSAMWGLNDFVVIYLACHAACLTCTGPGQNQCITCVSIGVYLSPANTCSYCEATCLNCQGLTSTDCNDCSITYPYKLNFVGGKGSCVAICTTGQAADASNFCVNCPTKCLNCQNGIPSLCLDCQIGYDLCDISCTYCDYSIPTLCAICDILYPYKSNFRWWIRILCFRMSYWSRC